jgi:hypothetical protein
MGLQAHEMGESPFAMQSLTVNRDVLSPASAGLKTCGASTWGLRPRLYAIACCAG